MTVYKAAPPVDIHDLILDLCDRLGIDDHSHVSRIEILPTKATVVSYQRDRGEGWISQLPDGTPAMITREVPVKT